MGEEVRELLAAGTPAEERVMEEVEEEGSSPSSHSPPR